MNQTKTAMNVYCHLLLLCQLNYNQMSLKLLNYLKLKKFFLPFINNILYFNIQIYFML